MSNLSISTDRVFSAGQAAPTREANQGFANELARFFQRGNTVTLAGHTLTWRDIQSVLSHNTQAGRQAAINELILGAANGASGTHIDYQDWKRMMDDIIRTAGPDTVGVSFAISREQARQQGVLDADGAEREYGSNQRLHVTTNAPLHVTTPNLDAASRTHYNVSRELQAAAQTPNDRPLEQGQHRSRALRTFLDHQEHRMSQAYGTTLTDGPVSIELDDTPGPMRVDFFGATPSQIGSFELSQSEIAQVVTQSVPRSNRIQILLQIARAHGISSDAETASTVLNNLVTTWANAHPEPQARQAAEHAMAIQDARAARTEAAVSFPRERAVPNLAEYFSAGGGALNTSIGLGSRPALLDRYAFNSIFGRDGLATAEQRREGMRQFLHNMAATLRLTDAAIDQLSSRVLDRCIQTMLDDFHNQFLAAAQTEQRGGHFTPAMMGALTPGPG